MNYGVIDTHEEGKIVFVGTRAEVLKWVNKEMQRIIANGGDENAYIAIQSKTELIVGNILSLDIVNNEEIVQFVEFSMEAETTMAKFFPVSRLIAGCPNIQSIMDHGDIAVSFGDAPHTLVGPGTFRDLFDDETIPEQEMELLENRLAELKDFDIMIDLEN